MTLQRSGVPLDSGTLSLALSHTNLKINIRTVQEEKTRARERKEGGLADDGAETVG